MPDSHPVPETNQAYHCYDCFLALNPAAATCPTLPPPAETDDGYRVADLQRKVDRLERELKEESELTADLIQCLFDRPHLSPSSDLPTAALLDALINREKWRTQVHDPCPELSNGAIRKEILNRCRT